MLYKFLEHVEFFQNSRNSSEKAVLLTMLNMFKRQNNTGRIKLKNYHVKYSKKGERVM